MRNRFFVLFPLTLLTLFVSSTLAACTGSLEALPPPPPEPPDAAPIDAAPLGKVTQHGTIVDYGTKAPIAGATVAAAGESVTTDATGAYSFSVEPGEPYIISVTAPGYGKLVLQERSIAADEDDGEMNLVSTAEANAVAAALDGYDSSLGALSVEVLATGSCASPAGATISVLPAGAARVAYFLNGMPSAPQTSVNPFALPSAVIYNVQPGVPLTLFVGETQCTQVPFPTVQGAIRYTGGGIETEAGGVTTFADVFLQ
jgi:hypothetical protein